MRMWGFPWLSWLCLALLAGVMALAMVDPAARIQLLLTLGLTGVLLLVARATRGSARPGAVRPDDVRPDDVRPRLPRD